jgi:hypothetical protein
MWGLDILGPFKKVHGGLTHLLVVGNKSKKAEDFIQDVIFHFGVPNSIITNNGTQFTRDKFLDLRDNNNIHVDSAVVTQPHMNGQVERTNSMILQGLKPRILTQKGENVHARLRARAGKWVGRGILSALEPMNHT